MQSDMMVPKDGTWYQGVGEVRHRKSVDETNATFISITSLVAGQATHGLNRLHVDFAGPMEGGMFLLVVDSYSGSESNDYVCYNTNVITIENIV